MCFSSGLKTFIYYNILLTFGDNMTAYIVVELDKLNSKGHSPMMTIYASDVKHAEINYRLLVPTASNQLLIAESKNVDFMFRVKED